MRDALVAHSVAARGDDDRFYWALPVVGETWDGLLNDINGQHVRAGARRRGAREGERRAGRGGRGRRRHGDDLPRLQGRDRHRLARVAEEHGGYTVGVLVQANHGWRERLTVAGAPVGRVIGHDVVPDPYEDCRTARRARARSS